MNATSKDLATRLATDPDAEPKVFCIGLNKTGTSSMKGCFQALGLGPVSSPKLPARKGTHFLADITYRNDYRAALSYARRYRSFEDRPWNVWEMYRQLDQAFPGSLYILTVREPEEWWRSVAHWLTCVKPHMVDSYCRHLKASQFDRTAFLDGYLAYNHEVREYFRGRSDFLEMDITGGDTWDRLCPFLGLQIPDVPFPHLNRQEYSEPKEG